eukprot:352919-Chlamydomonas_euryale.AAC.4
MHVQASLKEWKWMHVRVQGLPPSACAHACRHAGVRTYMQHLCMLLPSAAVSCHAPFQAQLHDDAHGTKFKSKPYSSFGIVEVEHVEWTAGCVCKAAA